MESNNINHKLTIEEVINKSRLKDAISFGKGLVDICKGKSLAQILYCIKSYYNYDDANNLVDFDVYDCTLTISIENVGYNEFELKLSPIVNIYSEDAPYVIYDLSNGQAYFNGLEVDTIVIPKSRELFESIESDFLGFIKVGEKVVWEDLANNAIGEYEVVRINGEMGIDTLIYLDNDKFVRAIELRPSVAV